MADAKGYLVFILLRKDWKCLIKAVAFARILYIFLHGSKDTTDRVSVADTWMSFHREITSRTPPQRPTAVLPLSRKWHVIARDSGADMSLFFPRVKNCTAQNKKKKLQFTFQAMRTCLTALCSLVILGLCSWLLTIEMCLAYLHEIQPCRLCLLWEVTFSPLPSGLCTANR